LKEWIVGIFQITRVPTWIKESTNCPPRKLGALNNHIAVEFYAVFKSLSFQNDAIVEWR